MIGHVDTCKLIELPKISDPRGNLTFIEGMDQAPFAIKRVYYLYDVPGGAERGGHAHKELQQLIVAMAGSFDVVLDDGVQHLEVTIGSVDDFDSAQVAADGASREGGFGSRGGAGVDLRAPGGVTVNVRADGVDLRILIRV